MTLILLFLSLFGTTICDPQDEVLQFWKDMSVQKPIKCTLNPNFDSELPKIAQKFIHDNFKVLIIETRVCKESEHPNYKLKGIIQILNGKLEGTGKLSFIDKTSALYEEKFDKICIDRRKFDGYIPQEIIGTFKNGVLVGTVKLKLDGGEVIITNFDQGYPKGLIRTWDKNGVLTDLYYKDIHRIPRGYSWKLENKFLVYHDNSFVKGDEELLSVAIPMNKSSEVLVGSYNSAVGTLENVHGANFEVVSNKNCIIELTWKPIEKKNFVYFFKTDIKVYHEPACEGNGANIETNPELQFKSWVKYLTSYHNITNGAALIPNHFKPELSPVHGSKLLTNLVTWSNEFNNYANFSIWNGPIHQWSMPLFSIDKDGYLHGNVGFSLVGYDNLGKTGSPGFLDWSPKYFYVKFNHGLPNGQLYIGTWKGQHIFTTVQDGVLHGPVYVLGQVSIMEMEVKSKINQKRSQNEFDLYYFFRKEDSNLEM